MRVFSLLAGLVLGASAYAGGLPPLFYAVVSDTQKPANDPLTELRRVVAQVNQMAPAFVLMPGDQTDTGSVAEYENVMPVIRQFAAPVLAMPGNHEAVAGDAVYQGRFHEYFGEMPYSCHAVGGWQVIRLDSVLFQDGKLAHEGAIDEAQLTWLKASLMSIPRDAPILLSQHHPLRYPETQTANEEELLRLFADRHLVYTVTGHRHMNDVYQDVDAIWHIVTGSVSFSCRPATDGIGYRLVSTVDRDLWTAWIDCKDPQPARLLARFSAPVCPPVATEAKQLVLRVRYRGAGELVFGVQGVKAPVSEGTVAASPAGNALRIRLPESRSEGTAFVPLPEICTTKLFTPGCQVAIEGKSLQLVSTELWESTAHWQHLSLKRPGETKGSIRILSPRPGEALARGPVPVVALVESSDPSMPEVKLGSVVGTTTDAFVAVVFQANGLQSRSNGFRNCVYVNDAFLTDIAPDRDVLAWEWFAFPLRRSVWEAVSNPHFRLTAGTPDDGSGANPPANNEDYQARDLLLFTGNQCLVDPALPAAKTIALGDNGPQPLTLVECRPVDSLPPQRWRLVLQAVDASALAPGETNVSVRLGDLAAAVPVVLRP